MSRTLFFLLLCCAQTAVAQLNLQRIGHLSFAPRTLAGCWHHVDSSGGEWALVGTSAGLSLVDLSDPAQPVERFAVPGLPNNWREVRTHQSFAYVGSEAAGSGITIVDLRQLPDTLYWKTWLGSGQFDSLLQRSHTVQASGGYLYVFGGGNVTNGATIADLSDPWNPDIIGTYTTNYVHDGLIRGDTLWTSEIYKGWVGVLDISDRSNPQLLATQPTPFVFPHNSDMSPDGRVLFTSEEKSNAPMTAFSVSDLDNITLLDKYWPSRFPSAPVHNVRAKGNFLVLPSYRGQLTIVDASRPDNLIETAWDTLGTSLVWDADPYLPSGLLFATAKQEGFFVYQPSYQPASWLEGIVRDAATGLPLGGAAVTVVGTANSDTTDAVGSFKTGAAMPGSYEVWAYREGYAPRQIPGIELAAGQVTTLDIALEPALVSVQGPENQALFSVMPTLFSHNISINLMGEGRAGTEMLHCQLIGAEGRVALAQSFAPGEGRLEMGAEALPAGVYFLQVWQAGRSLGSLRLQKQ